MSTVAPYRLARLASLFLSFSFGVIGFGVGVNALVKSNTAKDQLRQNANGATVNIDTADVFKSGVVVTVASGLLALASLFALPSALLSSGRGRYSSSRLLTVQSALLGFLTVFLFAALTPFTDFVANRQAKISAFLGAVPVPDSIIQQVEAGLGATPVYKNIDYLKNTAILPWFAFLFGLTSTILTFVAARRTAAAATTSGFGRNIGGTNAPSYAADDEKKANVETVQQV
ncbi:hypothetical protein EIP91_011499 [Steccherinum ochraceum]|uniref:Uncharacterized protein n=1 Tax=Steccherinum ochraceum TaxID=92696 RepID=A0A4R0RYE5_9APHY|nr:hypothetical protein EIP91_011499 [Steccherinum ochraceum]